MSKEDKSRILYENREYIINELKTRLQKDVAKEFGVSRTTLYRAVKRWSDPDYELFSAEKTGPKPIFFSEPENTREYFYWLGILATDGNLYRSTHKGKYTSRPVSRVTLALTDKDVVEKFAAFCNNPSRNITIKKHNNPNWKDSYIYAQLIPEEEADHLESVVGKTKKSLCVPDSFLSNSDFMRGVIDGDGHFYVRNRGTKKGNDYQIGLSTGSEAFAHQVLDTFQRLFSDGAVIKRGNTYRVYTNKKQTLYDALELFYRDAPEHIRMERTYENAMRILNEATY